MVLWNKARNNETPVLLNGCENFIITETAWKKGWKSEVEIGFRLIADIHCDHKKLRNKKRQTKYTQFKWNYCGWYMQFDIVFIKGEWYTQSPVTMKAAEAA